MLCHASVIIIIILVTLQIAYLQFPYYIMQTVFYLFYFILYSENQRISKLDNIGIFIDEKFH